MARYGALLLPGLVVVELTNGSWILHPLDDLGHGDKVDVGVVSQSLIQPEEEGIQDLRIVLQESRVEEKTERSSVGFVMAIEVISQELVELISCGFVGEAGVHHSTPWQLLLDGWLFTTIHLIHNHFPDCKGASGTVLEVTVTGVGHTVVQGVRPQRRATERRSHSGVVQEGILLHHAKLVVASYTQVRRSQTKNRVVGDVGEAFNDHSSASHLTFPFINSCLGPEGFIVAVTDGVDGNLVTLTMHFLDSRVIGVLMGDEEGRLDGTLVRVEALVENQLIEIDIFDVNGVVERDSDHLGHI